MEGGAVMTGPDGGFVSEDVAATLDRIAWVTPRHDPLRDPETRRRLHYEDRAAEREDVAVRAALTVAARTSNVGCAAIPAEFRGQSEDEAEGSPESTGSPLTG